MSVWPVSCGRGRAGRQLRLGLLTLAPSPQEASIPARLRPKHASLPKAGLHPHPPALRPGAELGKTTVGMVLSSSVIFA